MQIDHALISHLEHLSRLELSETERARLLADLNKILEMMEKLRAVDVEGVAPMVYMNELPNPLRPDIPGGQSRREDALRNAPENDGTYFLTPKVIDIKKG
jgi:aspartyl-tRNA(Asn)/glutamyl-tRNA(Gln) amidotransferase subunit C